EQVHDREIGRSVPASAVALLGFHQLHPLTVDGGKEHGAGKAANDCMQAGVHVRIAGKRLHDRLFVACNTSFGALCQPGAALRGAALLRNKIRAALAVNVFWSVLECVAKQRFVSFPGQRKRPVRENKKSPSGCLSDIELAFLTALAFLHPVLQQADDGF
ncbi:MAG: hypothetical protein K2I76_03525, partial [Malacoplasma sp.]|nr:hypothetical protein [Malacoplasma sp.]